MERLLISACLLGVNCKYSGGNNRLDPELLRVLREKYRLVPVCPEIAGGLPVPRAPSERRGRGVVNNRGEDVTVGFQTGGDIASALAVRFGCKKALLKENSPSCGSGKIYDGSFSSVLIMGSGVAAERLMAEGIDVFGESAAEDLL